MYLKLINCAREEFGTVEFGFYSYQHRSFGKIRITPVLKKEEEKEKATNQNMIPFFSALAKFSR